MQTNRFEQPLAAQFVNTYVPIPFEQMMQAGQMKQERYDKAAGATDALIGAMDDITAIPNSADELRAKDYANKMRSIRDKYLTRDLSDPFVQRELSNEINNNINKEDIKHIQQSYQGYLNYNKILSDYAAKGVDPPPEMLERFSGYDSTVKGVFTGTPQQQLDVYGDTRKFFEDMEMQYQGVVDLSPGVKGLKHAVTEERILEHAKNNIGAYMALPSVRQHVEVMKRRGLDEGKSREQLAFEYVQNHAPEFARSAVSNPFEDPNYVPGGGTGNPTGQSEPETFGRGPAEGEDFKKRQMMKDYNSLVERYKEGDTSVKNDIDEIEAAWANAGNVPREGSKTTPNENIERYQTEGEALFQATLDVLVDKGMPEDEAFLYLESNASEPLINMYKSGSKAGVMYINDPLLKGKVENIADAYRLNYFSNPLMPMEDKKRKEIFNEYQKANLSNEQILADYVGKSNDLTKKISKEQDNIEKYKLQEYNKLQPTQDTYTIVNGMFAYNKNIGAFEGTYFDKNGVSKKYSSISSKKVTDTIYNPNNYEKSFFDEKGKPIKKSEKIKEAIANSSGFTITGLDNNVTDSHKAKIKINMLNESGMPSGSNFIVEIPFDSDKELSSFVRELTNRNQTKTKFQQLTVPSVKAALDGVAIYDGEEISLTKLGAIGESPNNKIVFERYGQSPLIMPVLIKDGIRQEMTKQPVGLKNLPFAITNYLYNII